MKKIALLLVIAMATTTLLTAADVTVGGWMDVRGGILNQSGDAFKGATPEDDTDKTYLYAGSNEFELSASVTGERFGGRIGLIHWSGANGGLGDAPFIHNTYIYMDFVPEMVRLYGGVTMFPFGNYTSYAAVDGANFGGDAFGLGLGAYNYASYTFITKKPTGLALELKPVENLSILSILDVDYNGEWFKTVGGVPVSGGKTALELEDALKNNMHFNLKYAHDLFTIYAGLSTMDKDQATDYTAGVTAAMYAEASITAVEGLTADFKFETLQNDVSENTLNVISANLGYDLGAAKVGSEINLAMMDGETDTHIGVCVTPVVPVVGLKLKGAVDLPSDDNVDPTIAVGAAVSKSFGQATSNLELNYVTKEDANTVEAMYKITLWF